MLFFTAKDLIDFITSYEDVMSRPEVGSSRNKTFGMAVRAQAIETLRRWPPDTPRCIGVPIMLESTLFNPRPSIMRFTSWFISKSDNVCEFESLALNMRVSLTVNTPIKESSCSQNEDDG